MKIKPILSIVFLLTNIIVIAQNNETKEAAIFLDSSLHSQTTLKYFDPESIASVTVKKNDTIIHNKKYYGQIYIISKNEKDYVFLNLNQIKNEFTKNESLDILYMINGEFVKEDIHSILLDRNYILKVEVTNSTEFYNLRANKNEFSIINILTKTKKNIDEKSNVILRSHESIGIK
ncbi:hypothetical protein RCH18_002092 [Flavobacterium sp. PL11]|uniref:hypothetical protein n=1 Tax=Flavobacterium sp. PL11 TaxID=3071717 RepID=UPI002E01436E|nr:hypothetical protein [Flavobacterium sp. PL11]